MYNNDTVQLDCTEAHHVQHTA